MSDNTVTLVGNVTDDPELRFTPSGRPVANFTVAVNRRYKNNEGNWEDKLDGFFRCSCWADMAENAADTLKKGTRVLVIGRLNQRSWEDQQGNRRSAVEVQVDEVGPSLKWARANITKTSRSSGSGGGGGFSAPQDDYGQQGGSAPQQGGSTPQQGAPASGDWSSPSPVGGPPDEAGF
jgi:single-strand DNA-binding protein